MAKGIYKKWLEDDSLILLQGWKRNGLTDEQIAKNIGINVRTLDKWKAKYGRIRQALKIGHEQANYAVENKLLQKAMSGNTTAMIFWLKNNWRDKYNDSELSPEERKLATARMEKLKADTRISKARAKALEDNGQDMELLLDKMLDTITKEDKSNEPR
ncbi:small terminase subunit [Limosilactobacillus agrestimuris]|uniref:small terminase subunit n=1 Tax=Limosilactobacillus agrestimuris TaxID=2941331 RepID=UPI00203E87C1|nr:small terminase subunit [Limosilactobacillus agrestimuris]